MTKSMNSWNILHSKDPEMLTLNFASRKSRNSKRRTKMEKSISKNSQVNVLKNGKNQVKKTKKNTMKNMKKKN